MSDEIITKAHELAKSAHKRIDELDEKKLSKHEFNGHKHVVEHMVTGINAQAEKNELAQKENTVAINNLADTFHQFKDHLFELFTREIIPAIVKTLLWVGAVLIAIVSFFASKILGWW